MTLSFEQKRMSGYGIRTRTSILLLVWALTGLALRGSQVPVFDLGDSGPDARTFPTVALTLLTAALVLQLGLGLRKGDSRTGKLRDALPIMSVMIVGLWLMPLLGFIPCVAAIGIATALAFGERNILFWFGLPLVVAALIGLGADAVLNIPLP